MDGINLLENAVDELRRRGWFTRAQATQTGWTVTLECGVDVWPAKYPRPVAHGSTLMAAFGRAKELSHANPEE